MSPRCSIVIPVHNRAGLTRRCLDAILGREEGVPAPATGFEVIVVDDASTDSTPDLLSGYAEPVRALRLEENKGFAGASNAGAAAAAGEYLLFLNNDTVATAGWLDALVRYADSHPQAAVVGSKLLFPDETIQHAGVVICQDGHPRHIYAGFPAGHPAVCRSRRFQAVTAACALVRRDAFEQAGGFDEAFTNSLEDADLCLRLGELGHEVHYCHESVLYHLESASRPRRPKEAEQNRRVFRERWAQRLRRDDVDFYVADGLLSFAYRDRYPLGLEISGELATISLDQRQSETQQLIERQSRQLAELLQETVRLTAHAAGLDLEDGPAPKGTAGKGPLGAELVRRVEELEIEIFDLQTGIAEALGAGREGASANGVPFVPGEGLGYRKLVSRVRAAVESHVPAGSTLLVISRGDDHLLDLEGRSAWHFPQDDRGEYSGHHPSDSRAAIDQLESLREKGADYLLIPEPSAWWLDHYDRFASHLSSEYTELTEPGDPFRLFSLRGD